jgi:dTDP-D-glucose 4,6-dehydratase
LVWDRRRRYLGEQHHFLCQYPEKTIPLSIVSALQAKPLPIYGDGLAQGLR